MTSRVLIVDDDQAVLTVLYKIITANGHDADTVSCGQDALDAVHNGQYDLILLDINMHGVDGFEVIRTLRAQKIDTPIIVVSGRRDDYDTLYGLDIGADDYVTKPFNPVTLAAKAKALIRRNRAAQSQENHLIQAGRFSYISRTLRFYKNEVEIPLTGRENAMMKLFLDNVNQVFSNDMLYEMVWGEAIVDENAIMVYIRRLRRKIEDDPANPKYIQNIRGLGYRFVV